jgi:hypothetical protein
MAVEVTVTTLGQNTPIAIPGDSATVQDVIDHGSVNYDDSKIIRVNGEDASVTDYVENGDVISFTTPSTKHGA